MKSFRKSVILLITLAGVALSAKAQYGQMVNQVTSMMSTILNAGFNYKGYVEASYMKGIGENNGDFAGISTSQGTMYGDHFFMGVGLGVDLLMAHVDNADPYNGKLDKALTKTGCVMPIFSDFRGIFGNPNGTQFQLGLKLGCSFLLSDSYIQVNRGYITSGECLYVKPSVGVRIPVSSRHPKQAVSFALNYQLITPSYCQFGFSKDQSISLNSFGATIGFEW